MAEQYAGGQAPSAQPGFDLAELLAHLEAKLKPKREILPNAVYDRDEAVSITGFSLSTFIRAEQKQKLIGRWEGRRRFYFGRDLISWLTGEGNFEICGDTLADSISPTVTPTGIRCTTCANYRE